MPAAIKTLMQPFPLLIFAMGLSLLWMRWRQPAGRLRWRWTMAVYGLLLFDSLPASLWLTAGMLERRFPRLMTRPEHVRAIVVLGGGVIPSTITGDVARPTANSFQRLLRAAELYRAGPPCVLIVSGGHPEPVAPGETVAEAMARDLRHLGIAEADLVVESTSRNTQENARESAKLLRSRGITDDVLLVTTATHLPRSVTFFRREGIGVIPAGCSYRVDEALADGLPFVPRGTAVLANHEAFYEAIGLISQWLRRR